MKRFFGEFGLHPLNYRVKINIGILKDDKLCEMQEQDGEGKIMLPNDLDKTRSLCMKEEPEAHTNT